MSNLITRFRRILMGDEAQLEAGGDFTMCTVTIVNNSDDPLEIYLPHISEVDAYGDPAMMSNAYSSGMQSTDSFTCVLYKGKAQGAFVYDFRPAQSDVTTLGSISYDYDNNTISITGDGTITIE